MKILTQVMLICIVTLLSAMAAQYAQAAGKGRNSGANPPGLSKGFAAKPGVPPQVRIGRDGQISIQRISPKFGDAVAGPGPRMRRDFVDSAGRAVPKVLIKPDGTKEILPKPGIAFPTRKMENGKLTKKNGGMAVFVSKRAPWTRIHPPKQARGSLPGYPNGYITNSYRHGKPVHPRTFAPISKDSPHAHRDLGARSKQSGKR